MSDISKERIEEWWLFRQVNGDYIAKPTDDWAGYSGGLHVIEYSAYEEKCREVEERTKDKERLNWLARNETINMGTSPNTTGKPTDGPPYNSKSKIVWWSYNLREAIDAARAELEKRK